MLLPISPHLHNVMPDWHSGGCFISFLLNLHVHKQVDAEFRKIIYFFKPAEWSYLQTKPLQSSTKMVPSKDQNNDTWYIPKSTWPLLAERRTTMNCTLSITRVIYSDLIWLQQQPWFNGVLSPLGSSPEVCVQHSCCHHIAWPRESNSAGNKWRAAGRTQWFRPLNRAR